MGGWYNTPIMRSAKNKQYLRRFLFIKEIIMLTLVAGSLALLGLEHLERLSHDQLLMVEIYEIVVALIFAGEFVFEWYFARDRGHYIKYHWFYLLAAIPIPTQSFAILHGVRALRLLKLLKIFAHLRYEYNTWLFDKQERTEVY